MRIYDVVDSAFANNTDTRKSTNAYLGTIGKHVLINWISKGQNIVTVSSTEAKYVCISDGSKETTFTMHLLSAVFYVNLPSVIPEVTGAIFLSKNHQVGFQTKQIDVRHHFTWEKVDNGEIVVQYVNTCLNSSDRLSKNVSQKTHYTHAHNICNGTLNCWDDNRDVLCVVICENLWVCAVHICAHSLPAGKCACPNINNISPIIFGGTKQANISNEGWSK